MSVPDPQFSLPTSEKKKIVVKLYNSDLIPHGYVLDTLIHQFRKTECFKISLILLFSDLFTYYKILSNQLDLSHS